MRTIAKFFLSLSLLIPFAASGEVIAELHEFSRPSIFLVRYDRVYVMEAASVFIYNLKDFKLEKKFGKAGEGPREFKYDGNDARPLGLIFNNGEMIVNSINKLSYFDKAGNYLREENVTVDRLLFPIKDKYLGIGPILVPEKNKRILGFTLHDRNFKSSEVVFMSDFDLDNPEKILLPMTTFTYNPVYKDKIYINSKSDAFRIVVKDVAGKVLSVIEKDYPRIEVPASFRAEALEYFRTSPRFRRSFEFIKQAIEIRKYYPQIRDIQIVDDHIYVLSFKRKNQLWELRKLGLDGQEMGTVFIPLSRYEVISFYPVFYSVFQGRVYSMVEDEEDEVWRIHVTDFN